MEKLRLMNKEISLTSVACRLRSHSGCGELKARDQKFTSHTWKIRQVQWVLRCPHVSPAVWKALHLFKATHTLKKNQRGPQVPLDLWLSVKSCTHTTKTGKIKPEKAFKWTELWMKFLTSHSGRMAKNGSPTGLRATCDQSVAELMIKNSR